VGVERSGVELVRGRKRNILAAFSFSPAQRGVECGIAYQTEEGFYEAVTEYIDDDCIAEMLGALERLIGWARKTSL
jgi:hypothetical protein